MRRDDEAAWGVSQADGAKIGIGVDEEGDVMMEM